MSASTTDADPATLPLPPGTSGLPFLGELPELLKDGYGFVEARTQKYGPIFRTSILGRPTAVIVGPEATGVFVDARLVQRAGAMPSHVQTLFGGRALPVLDGEDHLERKAFVMAAFTDEALASYLPALRALAAESLAKAATGAERPWLPMFKRLVVESICTTILGIPRGPELDAVAREYETIIAGFSSLPIPLPGSRFSRAKGALARVQAIYEKNVRARLARPAGEDAGAPDGLARMLAVRSARDGHQMTVDEAKTELHHVVIAGLIVWAWLVTAVVELDRHPEVLDRLRAEVAALPDALSLEALGRAHFLQQVTMEIRRLSPVVQVFFGQARQDFAFAGHRVPRGWMVLWGIRSSHLRPEIYPNPEAFDPERFSDARAEHRRHPHAFAPNGAGSATHGHKCAGYEYAPLLLQAFLVELLRGGYRWTLTPRQDLSLDYRFVPPPPRDGLQVRLQRA